MTRQEAEKKLDNISLIDEGMYTGYYVHEVNELIDLIFDSFDKQKCSNCSYFEYEECNKVRTADTLSGLNEFVRIEIDNPESFYCADFDRR